MESGPCTLEGRVLLLSCISRGYMYAFKFSSHLKVKNRTLEVVKHRITYFCQCRKKKATIQALNCCLLDSFPSLKEVPGLETLTHQAFPLLLPLARLPLFSVVKPQVLNNSQPCYPPQSALYVPKRLQAIAALILSWPQFHRF